MISRIERRGWIARLLASCGAGGRPQTMPGGAVLDLSATVSPGTVISADGEFEADDDTRNWPVSMNEVPAWRLDDEWIAKGRGYKLPNYRTRAEYEAMVAKCAAALTCAESAAPESQITALLDPLPPADAAQQFLSWLRRSGRTGTLSNETLSTLYAQCCTEHRRAQTADNSLREALKRLPGVTKSQPNLKSEGGRRYRPIFWIINASSISRVSQETPAIAMAA